MDGLTSFLLKIVKISLIFKAIICLFMKVVEKQVLFMAM